MSLLLRVSFPLIGYLCTASVITAALGLAYLRHNGKLDDETTFRIVALLNGVDLKAIEESQQDVVAGTPREEPSFDERQERHRASSLQFDAKQKQLADSLSDFNEHLKQLNDETQKWSRLKDEVEQYLTEQMDLVKEGNLKRVREQLEVINPRKQAKPILIEMIKEGLTDEVILLLSSMKVQRQQEILKTFDNPEDLEMLRRVQRKMLDGEPQLPFINKQMKELEQLKKQDK